MVIPTDRFRPASEIHLYRVVTVRPEKRSYKCPFLEILSIKSFRFFELTNQKVARILTSAPECQSVGNHGYSLYKAWNCDMEISNTCIKPPPSINISPPLWDLKFIISRIIFDSRFHFVAYNVFVPDVHRLEWERLLAVLSFSFSC